ncbi:MAG: DNA repair protein RecN [Saprospiraceae bacterium]|nr:DNA repair protein RecN [Saprospiraceae bacterium]
MVCRLEINNYAIIESLVIDFSDQLNIITGETGSGKSILLGALGLILGKRADSKVLLNQHKKCIVEGTFDISQYALQTFFEEEDLDFEEKVVIRREINAEGKSRAFINDTPVNLKTLQNLTTQLVDLHEQFENLGINDSRQQLKMLDAFAHSIEIRNNYERLFRKYKSQHTALRHLEDKQSEAIKQRDYLQFQLEELLELKIDLKTDPQIEGRLDELEHAEEITSVLGNLAFAIEESEVSILGQIKELKNQLQNIERFHPAARELLNRINQTYIELEDIGYEAKKISEQIDLNPELANEIRSRVDKINSLIYKHQAADIHQLKQIKDNLEVELQGFSNLDEEIEQLRNQIEKNEKELRTIADELSKKRKGSLGIFEKKVNELLKELKMEHAAFKVACKKSGDLLPHGQDEIDFLFAPNKGNDFYEIKKVASGGEMSRLALITKSLVAGSIQMPTLVFDEIDSGVSGDVAKRMGEILQRLADTHQVISITHSPQVAAKASRHYSVYKETTALEAKTRVRELDHDARIIEIATMLSSSPPSQAAITSAKELIND